MADKRVTVTLECVDNATKKIEQTTKAIENMGKQSKSVDLGGLNKAADHLNSISKGLNNMNLSGLSKMSSFAAEAAANLGKTKTAAGFTVQALFSVAQGYKMVHDAAIQDFTSKLKEIGSVCMNIVGKLAQVGRGFLQLVSSMSNADLSFKGIAKTALDFDQTMERIAVKSGESVGKLTDKIKQTASETVFSMDEIAGAAENMIQNGRSVSEVYDEIYYVAGLATIGNLDLARSGDIVASTMNMFSKQGLTAAQVANVFATAANSSGANVNELAKSLENCGPIASQLNIPFQQVVGTLALMGDNAIKSGKAGTALKNILQRMSAPTKEVTKAINKYGLETARAKIVSGDLAGGLLELKSKLDPTKYSADELAEAGKQLAGSWGQAGLASVLNTDTAEMMAMFAAMDKGLVSVDALESGMESLMNTTEGQMLKFAANVQLLGYNIFKGIDEPLKNVMKTINDFLSKLNGGSSFVSAFKTIENASKGWGEAIATNITKAIGKIDQFVNGGGLKSVLQVGTNIIQGICKGINDAAANGSLQRSIDGIIKNVCNFIHTNKEAVMTAGRNILDALRDGIDNNKGSISTALNDVADIIVSWAEGSEQVKTAMHNFADIAIQAFIDEGCIKLREGIDRFEQIITGNEPTGLAEDSKNGPKPRKDKHPNNNDSKTPSNKNAFYNAGYESGNQYGKGAHDSIVEMQPYTKPSLKQFQEVYNQSHPNGMLVGNNFGDGYNTAFGEQGQYIVDTANNIGTDSANGISTALESMDASALQALEDNMVSLGEQTTNTASTMTTAFNSIRDGARTSFQGLFNIVNNQMINLTNSVRTSAVSCANIFRNQFVNMANIARNQMVNISNIVRNQAISWNNVIRNQCQNARNALTSSFLSMAAVARTQMVNISNIIRNQAVTWANIIRNQAQNARNALTSSFMSMAAVARTQMAKVLSVVQSYMSQIAAACNRTLTIKVNVQKTITTTEKTVKEGPTALRASIPMANMLSGAMAGGRTSIGLGTLMGAVSASATRGQTVNIEVPLYLEGREIARASAKYMDGELSRVNTRTDRKRGVK